MQFQGIGLWRNEEQQMSFADSISLPLLSPTRFWNSSSISFPLPCCWIFLFFNSWLIFFWIMPKFNPVWNFMMKLQSRNLAGEAVISIEKSVYSPVHLSRDIFQWYLPWSSSTLGRLNAKNNSRKTYFLHISASAFQTVTGLMPKTHSSFFQN